MGQKLLKSSFEDWNTHCTIFPSCTEAGFGSYYIWVYSDISGSVLLFIRFRGRYTPAIPLSLLQKIALQLPNTSVSLHPKSLFSHKRENIWIQTLLLVHLCFFFDSELSRQGLSVNKITSTVSYCTVILDLSRSAVLFFYFHGFFKNLEHEHPSFSTITHYASVYCIFTKPETALLANLQSYCSCNSLPQLIKSASNRCHFSKIISCQLEVRSMPLSTSL